MSTFEDLGPYSEVGTDPLSRLGNLLQWLCVECRKDVLHHKEFLRWAHDEIGNRGLQIIGEIDAQKPTSDVTQLIDQLNEQADLVDRWSPQDGQSGPLMRKAATELLECAQDTALLNWLQKVKLAKFRPLNTERLDISAVELFTVESQHVRGNTLREAIAKAMEIANDRMYAVRETRG